MHISAIFFIPDFAVGPFFFNDTEGTMISRLHPFVRRSQSFDFTIMSLDEYSNSQFPFLSTAPAIS